MRQRKKMQEAAAAYMFLLPALTLFFVFFILPVLAIALLSFSKFNIVSPIQFIGLENYNKFFLHDPRLFKILTNTLKFVVILVPLHLILGLLLALGVTRKISKGLKYFYRTVFYFPTLATTSSVAIAWVFIYNKDFGVINYLLGQIGIGKISWMNSPFWVYVAVAIFSIWKFVGSPFIYYLIGLQNIPSTLYEAAEIDGASAVRKFWHITLPLLSPTIFFVLVVTFIGATQIFEEPYILTRGGPGDETRTMNLYIYELAYQNYDIGYASTLALSLFLLILTVTLIYFKIAKKFVHYSQE